MQIDFGVGDAAVHPEPQIIARATETMGSDIDVLIIGSVDFGAVIDALHPAQEQLAREINPKVFSSREWKTNLKKKNRS